MNTKRSDLTSPDLTSKTPDEIFLMDLSDEDLRLECLKRLRVSYDHRDYTFHETHEALATARLECDRRGKPRIFDIAFMDL